MFKILRKTAQTGLVTIGYPDVPAPVPECFRGAPQFDFANWHDARPAAEACPTGAISYREKLQRARGHGGLRPLHLLRRVRRRRCQRRRPTHHRI